MAGGRSVLEPQGDPPAAAYLVGSCLLYAIREPHICAFQAHTHTRAGCAFRTQLELTSGPQDSEREDFQAEAASAEPPKQMAGLRGAMQGQGFHLVAVLPWAQTTTPLQASVSLSVG